MNSKPYRTLRNSLILLAFLTLAGLFFFFRGPYISNILKKSILPEISSAIGRDVTAQKIYINILPLFIEARDIKVFDSGKAILSIPRVKGYVSLAGFLKREINIRRLVVHAPELRSDMSQVEDIIEKVKEYLKIKREHFFDVKIRGVNLTKGEIDLTQKDSTISLKGVSGDVRITLPGKARINLSIMNSQMSLENWPSLSGSIRSSFFIQKDSIDLKTLDLKINGSEISSSGYLPIDLKDGEFSTQLRIFMKTLKGLFDLKSRGEGEIRASGKCRFLRGINEIRSDPLNSFFLDLDIRGNIHIESLLELVKVKEKIRGFVDFSGNLKGPLGKLIGKGKATMKDGNLYGIAVKTLSCDVSYREGMLSFSEGNAIIYNGTAKAKASVQIHGGNFYSVEVKAEEIDSTPLLDLIGWRPDIPPGKVNGEFRTYGREFNPSGWFAYRAPSFKGDYILRRIRSITGFYTMEKDILTLYNTKAETGLSELNVDGKVSLASSTLDLKTELFSRNISELVDPFLKDLTGTGRFNGTVKGRFDDPVISGNISMESTSLYRHNLDRVWGDISYRKKELLIRDLFSKKEDSEIRIKGSIGFREAKELFALTNPSYNLSASLGNIDLREIATLVPQIKPSSISGSFNADLTIKGKVPELKGQLRLYKPAINNILFDSASSSFIYEEGDLRFKDIVIKRVKDRESLIQGEGIVFRDETAQFRIKGDIYVDDVYSNHDLPVKGYLHLQATGKGKLENPEIEITANLMRASVRAIDIGNSRIKVYLKDKELSFESLLFEEKAMIKGKLDLRDISWTAKIDLKAGRYDSLIEAILKDVPEDLLVNIRGHMDMTGKGERFNAKGFIDELNITLYGYSFSSERDINFSMKDWRITLPTVRMRSGATSFDVQGVIDINKEIDITLEGRSNLSPLKGFSRKIETIRGETEFVLSVSGKWDSPEINGGLAISNGFVGIKGIPYRLSNAKGYLYIDEDRIVIDKISGNIGGGDIDISGITYLKGFRIRKFYIDTIVNNMTWNISKDFPVNFNGNLLLRGSPESRSLSGEIRIKRARYKDRVEWKSWLLKAKIKERPRGEIGVMEDTELNIKIYGTEDIIIDNNIARAQVKLDMLLRGTVFQPIIFGRVESTGGTVYFRNNEFRIVKASADFSDPKRINPVMEIVAEASVKGYNIRLNLEGQMEQFNLSLISDPPLPEMDILSLLTVGKFGKELKGIEGGIGAGEATSFLTGKMQDVLEERVRSLTGLDRVEVDPYVSKTTGTVSPRITVSKRLLGDRLFVTYSSAAGTADSNVLKLEYLLNRNISLIGVRDEKGGIGGDIKFRFEFR